MSNIVLPYTQIIDPASFKSILNAKIYIGEYGTLPNPANSATWKQAYFVQDDGTRVAASQPIRTNAAGFAVDGSGNIRTVQVDGQYSLLVQDSFNVQKYSNARVNEFSTSEPLSVDAITTVNATGLPDGIVIIAKGRSAVGDGGGGMFRYSASSVQTADGGTVFTPAIGSGRLFRDGWTVIGYKWPVEAKWFGATGDNSTDDTSAVQSLFNSGYKDLLFHSGTFLCGNLTLPGTARVRIVGAGKDQTVIKAKSGISNTAYFAAQPAYVNNSTNGSEPLVIEHMQFDGAGLVDRTFVYYSYFSEFNFSACKGGNIQSLTFTSEGISGALCSTTLVENKVINSVLEASGSAYALRIKDSGAKCTDMIVHSNVFNGDVIFDTMAGVNFLGNHVYAGNAAFNRLSNGSIVDANYFENTVSFDDFKDEVVSIGTNDYLDRVTCSFGTDGRVIVFDGGTWRGSADVFHSYFDPARRIIVNGGSFETATPVVFHNGTSTGWVSFNRVFNYSTGLFYTGSRQASINSIRSELPFSPSVSTNFGDASATLTWGVSATTNRWATTLTTDKTVTLSTTNAISGAKFKIVRSAGGAFNLNVGTGPLKALASNTWCEVEHDGSAWFLSSYGSL